MKKLLTILFLFIFIVGCAKSSAEEKTQMIIMPGGMIAIHKICSDKVVCYDIDNIQGNSGSCFRDEDLILKYCN